MKELNVQGCFLEGVKLIEPQCFQDVRGSFMEVYQQEAYLAAGISCRFVQDNQVCSGKGVLRGLHFQRRFPQAKLVWALKGEIFDVAVDLRRESGTYGKWFGCILSEMNRKQIYIPAGFAHGYLVLSDLALVLYKCSQYYHPEDEAGIRWDDKTIGIQWPTSGEQELRLSQKDRMWPSLQDYETMRDRNGGQG